MAHQTGQFLQSSTINAVYSSPLKRAYQTTQQMLMTLPNGDSLPLHTSDLLQEVDLPAWEGLPYQVVRERFADDYRHWKEQPHTFQMASQTAQELATAEQQSYRFQRFRSLSSLTQRRFPVLDLYERASRFWQTVIPRYRGQILLVVSHGGAIRALISTALNLAPNYYHQLQQSNCGISVLNFSPDWNPFTQPAQLEMMNGTAHLGETLPKLKEGRHGLRLLLLPCLGDYSEASRLDVSSHNKSAEQIAHQLQSAPIDFSLTSNLPNCMAMVNQVLQPHQEVVQLQVARQDFTQVWQGAIASQSFSPATADQSLTTGLVVAPAALVRHIAGQALKLKPGQINYLQFTPNSLSVLHSPNANHSSILQALNFLGHLS
jgi:broad specificity phosphatase PhoE